MLTPDNSAHYKKRVAASFSRAACSYDLYAQFQERVLASLASLLPSGGQRWLDLGTGTGKGLAYLSRQYMSAELWALDISPKMLLQAQEKPSEARFICADAEHLPFAENVFAGIFSSLAIQWCAHQQQLFTELFRVLEKGGVAVLSTLLEESMLELKQAWSQVDGYEHTNNYPSLARLLDTIESAGFVIETAQAQTFRMWYESPKTAVMSLKKIGASVLDDAQQSLMTPSRWRAFEQSYESQRQVQGIPLSYQVALLRIRKS